MKKGKKDKSEAAEIESLQAELEEHRKSVENLTGEKDELLAKLQRVSADYANFQRRVPKQVADNIAYEKEKILKTVLPVLDNFEHTLQNANSSDDFDALVKGIRIVYDQMLDVLKVHGVVQIESVGTRFDPSKHEAMMRRTEDDQEDEVVLEEFQKGYRLNDRVLRPSKVVVNKKAEADSQADTDEAPVEDAAKEQDSNDEAAEPSNATESED